MLTPPPWPDRRPIGVCDLSMGGYDLDADPGFRTKANPNGWNPSLFELNAKGAVKDFHASWERIIRGVVIPQAKRFGCQGVRFQDIEGSADNHPTTYRGSPVAGLTDVDVHMVKWAVDELARNDLWAGFTLRPSRYLAGQQVPQPDPAYHVACVARDCFWAYGPNVKAFYLDSWVDYPNAWADGSPKPLGCKGLPDGFLYMPEFGTELYPGWGHPDCLTHGNFAPWRQSADPANPTTLRHNKVFGSFEIIRPSYEYKPTEAEIARVASEMRDYGHVMEISVVWPGHPDHWWVEKALKAAQN